MKEQWKSIKGYEGYYEVSSQGRVKSLPRFVNGKYGCVRRLSGKIMKLTPHKIHVYYSVSLRVDGVRVTKKVHQLVAEAFLNHTPNGYESVVNHIDFNRLNNNLENLEIVTQRENANKKHIKSSSKYTGVYWHKNGGKWCSQITIKGKIKYLGLYSCELAAANAYKKELNKMNN